MAPARNATILPAGIESERSVNCGIKRYQGLLNQCLHLGGVQPERRQPLSFPYGARRIIRGQSEVSAK